MGARLLGRQRAAPLEARSLGPAGEAPEGAQCLAFISPFHQCDFGVATAGARVDDGAVGLVLVLVEVDEAWATEARSAVGERGVHVRGEVDIEACPADNVTSSGLVWWDNLGKCSTEGAEEDDDKSEKGSHCSHFEGVWLDLVSGRTW